jgi:bifunctional enzyme CysN/CysC
MMMALALARDDDTAPGAMREPLPAARPMSLAPAPNLAANLHVLTCGSVDDGKSTLIGRLLWDTWGLHADQRETVQRAPKTAAGTPDFSLLVDGLAAEREQGITIDIAWRYLDTPSRRLVIIDSPGHEQYTRNMATGASHADVAILLVDARGGIKEQTRRHAAILDLIGVRRVVLAVNKMDLVGWSEARFCEIRDEFQQLAERFGFDDAAAIPVSAVLGDNIARRSLAMPWYAGAPLLDHLTKIPARVEVPGREFRFPVQFVVRAGQDFRGLAGTISSGRIDAGDEVVEPVGGRRARISRIVTMGRDLESASEGQAVVLLLDKDIDVSRGAVLASPSLEPPVTRSLDVRLVWLADERFNAGRGYLLRTATDIVPVASIDIRAHVDLESSTERPASGCAANDIAIARIDLGRRTAIDRFSDQRETGSFMLIDPITGASVAGGVVVATHMPEARLKANTFRLTRDLVARGIGADLPAAGASESELRRRANEVAILLREAGVAVEIEDTWGRARIDAAAASLWAMAILSFGFVAFILLKGLF